MKSSNKKITTFESHLVERYGQIGSEKRTEFEAKAKAFVIGELLKEERLEANLTQEELAEKVGTSKSYISKIENNLKETRISTLQKIVELGFGGRLELSIKI